MEDGPHLCEVCQREAAVGVACVPGIPMSAAYGRECLDRGADPYWAIRANVMCCGGPDHVNPEYLKTVTFLDGEYITLSEALKRYPPTEQEIRKPLSDLLTEIEIRAEALQPWIEEEKQKGVESGNWTSYLSLNALQVSLRDALRRFTLETTVMIEDK